jgi:methyltransferase-like protein/SAM-dependent methyltransferase
MHFKCFELDVDLHGGILWSIEYNMSEDFTYDQVPYPSLIFPQTNIDRLATLARYFGMHPADPANCRVLELGCGDGTNLLAQAYGFPDSSFIGIDLSSVQIDDGRVSASRLGLTNADLMHGNILDLATESLGKFDYIIAHGLYSWIPQSVRDHTMAIYRDCLADNGVGYVSFNINPGSYFRKAYWEAIKFRTREIFDLPEKMAAAKKFAEFLKYTVVQDGPFKSIVDRETGALMSESASYIFHDDLAGINEAFFFHEFVETAAECGLQFLSDANPPAMFGHDFSPEALRIIDEISGGDFIKRQQYFDLIRCGRFRSTLLCSDDIKLDRFPGDEVIDKFFIVSPLVPSNPNACIWESSNIEFATQAGSTITTDEPLTKAALVYLDSIWSGSAPFDEIVREAKRLLGEHSAVVSEKDINSLRSSLRHLFEGGVITLHTTRRKFSTEPGVKPKSSLFTQLQLVRGDQSLLSVSGMNYSVENDFLRKLLQLLDGTRSRSDLIEQMGRMVDSKAEHRRQLMDQLPSMIDSGLKQVARLGFLES